MLNSCKEYSNTSNNKARVIIKFKSLITKVDKEIIKPSHVNDEYLRNTLNKYNIENIYSVYRNRYSKNGYLKKNYSKSLDSTSYYYRYINLKENVMPSNLMSELEQSLLIDYIYIEESIEIKPSISPNDSDYNYQWHLNNTSIPSSDIDAEQAWTINKGRSDVIIAICDGGIDYNHSDLDTGNRSRIIQGIDTGDDDNDPMDDLPDVLGSYRGHGTKITGIIGAITDNNNQVSGIMWNCKIMPIKMVASGRISNPFGGSIWDFSTTAFPSDVADAIDYAVNNGAHVINLSYGFELENNLSDIKYRIPLLYESMENAYNNNVVLVASMGNEKLKGNPIEGPAYFHNTIAVGSTDRYNNISSSSNTGSHIDVSAPGVKLTTTSLNDSTISNFSGTSAAAPVVSGVAGLIISQGMDRSFNLTNDDVEHILELTADDRGSTGFDEVFGYGKINAYNALKLLDEPNNLIHGISYGGTATKTTFDKWLYISNPRWDLATGVYFYVDKYEINKHITFENIFSETPTVWIRERESLAFNSDHPNQGETFAEISNVSTTGFDLKYYVYYANNGVNKWIPANINSSKVAYTIVGKELKINGNTTVCISNSTYTIENFPSGTSAEWSNSSNLISVSDMEGETYTVKANPNATSEHGWIKVNLNGSSSIRKNILVGTYIDAPIITPVLEPVPCTSSSLAVINNFEPYYTYSWIASMDGTIIGSNTGSSIDYQAACNGLGEVRLSVTATNSCGLSKTTNKYIDIINESVISPFGVSIAPNPTDSELTIQETYSKDNSLVTYGYSGDKLEEIILYDKYYNVVFKNKYKDKKIKWNTVNLKEGIYYLHIKTKKKLEKKQIYIKH